MARPFLLPSLPLLAFVAVVALSVPCGAASLDQRVDEVAKTVDAASDMFNSAKKGHLPSLEAINELQARMELSRRLLAAAREEAAAGKKWQAGASLDAAQFLAAQVFEAARH